MDRSTLIGGEARGFPATSADLLAEARGPAPRDAIERLVAIYWKPVYSHVRRRWRKPNEDAKDLTQAFFAMLIERDAIRGWRAEGPRFRSFVRALLENFLVDAHRHAHRLRRGGCERFSPHEALDETAAPDAEDPFDREWAAATVRACLAALEQRCAASGRAACFEVLRRIALPAEERPTYAEVASAMGLSVDGVHNHLRLARRLFREELARHVRTSVTSDQDAADELAALFGGGLAR